MTSAPVVRNLLVFLILKCLVLAKSVLNVNGIIMLCLKDDDLRMQIC